MPRGRRFAGAECRDCGEWTDAEEWCDSCRRCLYCCECEDFDADEMGEDPEEAADYATDVGSGAGGGGSDGSRVPLVDPDDGEPSGLETARAVAVSPPSLPCARANLSAQHDDRGQD